MSEAPPPTRPRLKAHFYWLSGHDATVAALMAMQVGERAREEAERAKVDRNDPHFNLPPFRPYY
jgi:hypothetical protein